DFQKRACFWGDEETARGFVGDWGKMDVDKLLQGRVSGPDGQPIAYAGIIIREYKADRRGSIAAPQTGASEQGRYYFDAIEWPYRVGARWHEMLPEVLGHRSQTILRNRVFEGPQAVNFRFDAFATGRAGIKGRVVDQNGNPVPEFHLWLVGPVGWEKKPWDGKSKEDIKYIHYSVPFISDDGSFELSGLPGGVFVARAIPFDVQAYERSQGVELELKEGKTTEAEVRVMAKNTLYGRVLFEDGQAPAADEIYIVLTMMGRGRGVGGVDSEGYFTVHFSDRELEAVKAGMSAIVIIRKDSRQRLGTFPVGLLSPERSKAGILKVPRVPPKEKKKVGTGLSSKSALSGKSVVPFELLGIDGRTYRLADYEGKPVLINVFATWCRPCLVELPHLLEANTRFADKGLVILAISHMEKAETVEAYARRYRLPYPVLVDRMGRATQQFANKLGRIGFPTNVLLDRDHKIVYSISGFSEGSFAKLEEVIQQVLDQPRTKSRRPRGTSRR
ncbi:MAG: TlpA family protein disulfide reductase, partial [Planctomycetota bacterium]